MGFRSFGALVMAALKDPLRVFAEQEDQWDDERKYRELYQLHQEHFQASDPPNVEAFKALSILADVAEDNYRRAKASERESAYLADDEIITRDD